ncbi:unnamed protein product [Toxocara canis]|uniref:TGF-beta family profile domain-containing protein n=1 Tax=Toxocara canis TaxID=6265 RepID=A0A3P7I513_TOXCA|nr:unnamed protein product [Toxocara canis]
MLGVLDRLHAKMFATHLLSLGVEDCERFLGRAEFSGNSSNNGYFECCRRMVHLDFSETRLSGWGAKHPNSVKGYYCVGHCTRYGGYAFSAQTGDESFYSELMNAHASSLGLSPCCAPVRFDPLTVTVRHGTTVKDGFRWEWSNLIHEEQDRRGRDPVEKSCTKKSQNFYSIDPNEHLLRERVP